MTMTSGLAIKIKKGNVANKVRRQPANKGCARQKTTPHTVGGNHSILRKIESGQLKVSQPGDKYEREADRVAQRVTRMPNLDTTRVKCDEPAVKEARTVIGPLGENFVTNQPITSPDIVGTIRPSFEGGRPLPESVQSLFEPRFGASFSDIRVHTDFKAHALTRALSAKAVTAGRDIYFSRQRYKPRSLNGQRLLAHELTHVIQNRRESGYAIQAVARLEPEENGWWECIKGAAAGFGGGIWDLLRAIGGSILNPIETIQNAYNGIVELIETIRRLDLAGAAKQLFQKIYTLVTRWSELVSYRRCKLIGEIIGEYGAGLLSGAGIAKIINKLKRLKRSIGSHKPSRQRQRPIPEAKEGRIRQKESKTVESEQARSRRVDPDIEEAVERAFSEGRVRSGELIELWPYKARRSRSRKVRSYLKKLGKRYPGEALEAAHGAPRSAMRSSLFYDPDAALTRVLPRKVHRKMDRHWKKRAWELVREGRTHWTVQEMFDAVSDSIRRTPGLSDAEKFSHIARLEDEILEFGLAPTDLVRLPFSR